MNKDTKARLLLILYLTGIGLFILVGIILMIFFAPECTKDTYGNVIECK